MTSKSDTRVTLERILHMSKCTHIRPLNIVICQFCLFGDRATQSNNNQMYANIKSCLVEMCLCTEEIGSPNSWQLHRNGLLSTLVGQYCCWAQRHPLAPASSRYQNPSLQIAKASARAPLTAFLLVPQQSGCWPPSSLSTRPW